jgi:AraC family transcriptional activator of pobA
MEHAKETLSTLVREMQTVTTYNKGVYILNIEFFLDKYSNEMFRAGAFFYILVETGTAEFVIDCHSYIVGKGDMLLVAPRMSVKLMKKSSDFGTCGLCMEPFFFDSLSIGNYVYKRLYNSSHTTYVLRLEDSDTVHIRKTLDLMSHYLTSDHPAEMAGSLVNFLLLQITEIFHSQNVHPAGRVKHSDALFRLFRKLLAENYRKEHELQFYADSLHISQTYLSRVIRQISGKTVNNYIAEALYTDARRLLVFTDLTVKEIAEQLGFSDQSSFGKFFKKKSETSPANFRDEYKKLHNL